jgi:predicted TIM-barrel fold metal-dependent hydrolase
MCARFPDTPVVIDHLARIGADGNVRDSDVRLLCRLAKHRHVYVKVSAFYALGRKQAPYTDLAPMIRRVFQDYGPQRLMWASDCPFQVEGGHTYEASLALVREHLEFLSRRDREWLLMGTAESLFFRR